MLTCCEILIGKASVGSIKVAELDWRSREHAKATGPPFDFIIGTDVVSDPAILLTGILENKIFH